MSFWDSSALAGLCLSHQAFPALQQAFQAHPATAVWWGTRTECLSAFARLRREGKLDEAEVALARVSLSALLHHCDEIQPSETLRLAADHALLTHPLRAADAFQLSAALQWCGQAPQGSGFVCLDRRLREAAGKEGLQVLPA